jgi:hypothetical protein
MLVRVLAAGASWLAPYPTWPESNGVSDEQRLVSGMFSAGNDPRPDWLGVLYQVSIPELTHIGRVSPCSAAQELRGTRPFRQAASMLGVFLVATFT